MICTLGTLWPTHFNNWSFGRSSMGSAQHPPFWYTIVSQQFPSVWSAQGFNTRTRSANKSFISSAGFEEFVYSLLYSSCSNEYIWKVILYRNRCIETFTICLWSTKWNKVLEFIVYSLYFREAGIAYSVQWNTMRWAMWGSNHFAARFSVHIQPSPEPQPTSCQWVLALSGA